MLTGSELFNIYTSESSESLLNHFMTVLELTQDNQVQQQRLNKLKLLLDARISMVHRHIKLRNNKSINAAVEVVNKDSGDTLDKLKLEKEY